MTSKIAPGEAENRVSGLGYRVSAIRNPQSAIRNRPAGFSLVELIAVIALLAIFAALAVVSLRGHVANARLELLLDRIEALDARVRDEAQRHQRPGELRVDIDRGRVYQLGAERAAASSRNISLDEAVQIDRIQTGTRNSQQGELRVPISLH